MVLRILFALCILLAPVTVHADEPLLIVTNTFAPHVFDDPEKPGTMYEVTRAAFAAAGIRAEFRFFPWRRCTTMVQDGTAFATFPYIRNAKREQFALFSEPLREERSVFFFRKDSAVPTDITSLEQLKPYRIGGTLGYHYEQTFREAGLNVDYAANQVSAFNKLLADRVDYVADGEVSGRYLAASMLAGHADEIDYTDWAWKTTTGHLMVSRAYPNASRLLERFNEGLARIRADGTYEAILVKYGLGPKDR